MRARSRIAVTLVVIVASLFLSHWAFGQEYEEEPIRYSDSEPNNRVSQVLERIEAGELKLKFSDRLGYLPALLQELNVPASSQMLVFSKTSLQRQRIAPRTPRAIYFSDDVYIGYCQQGAVLEISAVDPQLGAVFYTLDQDQYETPLVKRQTDNCLLCHGSGHTKDVPGHVVRSVFSDAGGLPILSSGSYRINQASPLAQRWGGWYVTGTHGEQKHLGNLIIPTRDVPERLDNSAGMNVTDLADRFNTGKYLTPHSDIVALMVLEHQAEAHNLLTRASMHTRQAMHYQQALNRELGEPADKVWDSTKSRIKSVCEPLVEYLLFSEEAQLASPIHGTSGFAEEFVRRGPRDRQGRSLRDFDLSRRLFQYPCSYLVYSPNFQELPREAKDYVLRRMWEVLSGADQSEPFAHLSADDRQAILEILRETLPDLPDSWNSTDGA
ncbi:MAG TPA: hypothetical protein VFV87_20080 [Pirellulaceae bacterium]|nr:hypothetical protein [Pirellulaceae bacterium]